MNFSRLNLRNSFAAFALTILAACGGGGSSGGNNPPPATAPTISTQPANASVTDGADAMFSVTAAGTAPLSYQWRRGGTNIGGATSASYTLTGATLADSGAVFSVVVTNSAGNVTSGDATLTVNPIAVSITTQPQDVTATDGTSATFTVVAAGSGPIGYQWQRNGVDIVGATSDSYNIASVVPGDNGAVYSVVIMNPAGPVTSNNATLTVTLIPPSIVNQPANLTVLEGAGATFTVDAAGSAPLSYQWKRGGTNIGGANSNSYTLAAAAHPGDNGAVFSVVVSNGSSSVTSNNATLTVTQQVFAPTISTQPSSASVLEGDQASFTVAATGTSPFTYQWQNNGVNISGATSATLSFTSSVASHNGHTFRAVVTNSKGSATSNNATLTVTPQGLNLLAGKPGGTGDVDGTGTAARFSYPTGVAVDAGGNTYVADYGNQEIRKITSAGAVTTLAGAHGAIGTANGVGSVARFNNPRGIAVNSAGTAIYVADQGNGLVRKVTAAGNVSTLVGSLSVPVAVALSDTSNVVNNMLYVVQAGSNSVTAYNATTGALVGTVVASGDGLSDPTGIAVDSGADASIATDDILYIADSGNTVVRKFDRSAVTPALATLAGVIGDYDSADGNVTNARFNVPAGLALIGTKLYVSDNGNHTVRVIDLTPGADATSGFVNTLAGSAGAAGSVTGVGSAARFRLPAGIASDGATLLKVADWGNDVVREIVASTANVSTLAGDPASRGYANGTGMAALFNYPRGVATDASGNAYVADSLNHVIRRVTPAGVTTLFAGTPGVIGLDASPSVAATSAHFNNPVGIAVSSTGDVYVADRANNAIRKISGGNVTVVAAGAPLNGPRGVVVASNGDLYVANTSGHTIVKIVGATVTTFAGTGVAGSSGDGMAASSATFRQPGAVALDGNTLYVADTGNFRVRKIDLNTGVVTAFVGANGIQGTQNGTGSGAQFGAIDGLAVDAAQNVYIADTQSHQIRKATSPGGVVTTLAGAASIGVATGALPGSLNLPSGVAVAPSTVPGSTRLVLTDGVEHAILEAIVKP